MKCPMLFNDLLSPHSGLFIVQEDNHISFLRTGYFRQPEAACFCFCFFFIGMWHGWDNVGRTLLLSKWTMDNHLPCIYNIHVEGVSC